MSFDKPPYSVQMSFHSRKDSKYWMRCHRLHISIGLQIMISQLMQR